MLEAEVADIAKLRPLKDHDLIISGGGEGAKILDGDNLEKVGQVTWRPGGARLAAYHCASGRLYVLMHEGVHWTHAQPGTEVWVLNTVKQELESRYALPQSANSIAVTQDAHPVLFAISEEWLWALDAQTGDVLHARQGIRGELLSGKDF